MVLSAWRGIKAPKLNAGDTPINSCVGFRVIELELMDETLHPPTAWQCGSETLAWVVRIESLVCILDCDRCALSAYTNIVLHGECRVLIL